MQEITIIGLGGVGSILANSISRFVNVDSSFQNNCLIHLVDGDKYEYKNIERQEFMLNGLDKNKAVVKRSELERKFDKVRYESFEEFANESNIVNLVRENSIVFIAVDNHKTRKIVSNYANTIDNIVVISGGNEFIDGNVQIFVKKGGVNLTPTLTDYHPEIENATDKSPQEMSCEELSLSSTPQLFFTNFMVASYMCSAFYNVVKKNDFSRSEVYFDLETMNANSKIRAPKQQTY